MEYKFCYDIENFMQDNYGSNSDNTNSSSNSQSFNSFPISIPVNLPIKFYIADSFGAIQWFWWIYSRFPERGITENDYNLILEEINVVRWFNDDLNSNGSSRNQTKLRLYESFGRLHQDQLIAETEVINTTSSQSISNSYLFSCFQFKLYIHDEINHKIIPLCLNPYIRLVITQSLVDLFKYQGIIESGCSSTERKIKTISIHEMDESPWNEKYEFIGLHILVFFPKSVMYISNHSNSNIYLFVGRLFTKYKIEFSFENNQCIFTNPFLKQSFECNIPNDLHKYITLKHNQSLVQSIDRNAINTSQKTKSAHSKIIEEICNLSKSPNKKTTRETFNYSLGKELWKKQKLQSSTSLQVLPKEIQDIHCKTRGQMKVAIEIYNPK